MWAATLCGETRKARLVADPMNYLSYARVENASGEEWTRDFQWNAHSIFVGSVLIPSVTKHRTDYYPRQLGTHVGTMGLRGPQNRKGHYSTQFF